MKKVKSRQAPAKATRRQSKPKAAQKKAVAAGLEKAEKPGSGKATAPPRRKVAKPKPPPRAKAKARSGKRSQANARSAPAKPALHIRELDPLRICGDRTSVMKLFRVDEQLIVGKAAGARQVHLVFNDRHGWYCEHGRSCHAVSAVMRHARIR